MREHLFRGFHPDKNGITEITLNGEKIRGYWVDGNLFVSDDKTECQILMGNKTIRIAYDVLLETICEYTGLTDKNGKKIFEGNIIEGDGYREIVSFKNGCFHPMGAYYARSGFAVDKDDYEIVGNIFENPELLK